MHLRWLILGTLAGLWGLACRMSRSAESVPQNGWWEGDGIVVPHQSFPSDCKLCHVGKDWLQISEEFTFDHAAETGVELEGAHAQARCLRCHNDRGPVEVFTERGCAACHGDPHQGRLADSCTECHDERSWQPRGMLERHARSRFPLIGAHRTTACRRCHEGAEVGVFMPVDSACLSCHADDLARALNPNHQALGFTADCNRCHRPTTWQDAQSN